MNGLRLYPHVGTLSNAIGRTALLMPPFGGDWMIGPGPPVGPTVLWSIGVRGGIDAGRSTGTRPGIDAGRSTGVGV